MKKPDLNISSSADIARKKKRTDLLNLLIMAAAIVLAIWVYNLRKLKMPAAEKGIVIKSYADSNMNKQGQPVKGK
jgi:hypothetical protein